MCSRFGAAKHYWGSMGTGNRKGLKKSKRDEKKVKVRKIGILPSESSFSSRPLPPHLINLNKASLCLELALGGI